MREPFDIDALVEANIAANEPPDWWPIPPLGSGIRMSDYFPMIGMPRCTVTPETHPAEPPAPAPPAPRIMPEPEVFTDRDIIDMTYRGDTLRAIAARMGRSRRFLRFRMDRNLDLAAAVDRKRGAVVTW